MENIKIALDFAEKQHILLDNPCFAYIEILFCFVLEPRRIDEIL